MDCFCCFGLDFGLASVVDIVAPFELVITQWRKERSIGGLYHKRQEAEPQSEDCENESRERGVLHFLSNKSNLFRLHCNTILAG